MRALFGFAQIVAACARDDVLAVRDEMLEHLLEREHLRLERDRPVGARLADRHEREHVEAETRLQRRVLVELVEHDLRRRDFCSSTTMRMPLRFDSSSRRAMPVMRFSACASAIASMMRDL